MRSLRCTILCSLTAATLAAAPPRLTRLDPVGGQRGTAVRLTVEGSGLSTDSKIETSLPAAVTPLAAAKDPSRQGRELTFLVEIDPDAAVNAYPLRIEGENGLSNVLLFTVGAFPEAAESESQRLAMKFQDSNGDPESAQSLAVPSTVNGRLEGPDRDFYRFQAAAGQRLVLEAESRRIGSAIDPLLELFDASGRRIAWNQDAPGIAVDARIDHRFEQAGEYFVAVRDSKFSAQQEDFYRLKIGAFDYAVGAYPLGWRGGESVSVELIGGPSQPSAKVEIALTDADAEAGFVEVYAPGAPGALPLRLLASDQPERIESSDRSLTSGVIVNGRIAADGERDSYRLAVEPGQTWQVELHAGKLGLSQLYGVLTLYDQDQTKLASTADVEMRDKLSNLDFAEDATADQLLTLEIPDGVSELVVEIEDLLGRGGADFAYRITARCQSGDFSLELLTQQLNVPRGGSGFVLVRAERLGYDGPITLSIDNAPDDVAVRGGHIPAYEIQGAARQASQGFLTLTAAENAKPARRNLEIWGEAEIDGALVRRRARNDGVVVDVESRLDQGLRARGYSTNVAPPVALRGLPSALTPPQPATAALEAPDEIRLIQGRKVDIPYRFEPLAKGVRPTNPIDRSALVLTRNVRVGTKHLPAASSAVNGSYELGSQLGWGPGRVDVVLAVRIADEIVYSPAITLDIIRAYDITAPEELSTLPAGGDGAIVLRIRRELDFDHAISIRADNLPLGVDCESVDAQEQDDVVLLPCRVDDNVAPGDYEIKLASGSEVVAGDGKKIPFDLPPFDLPLRVN